MADAPMQPATIQMVTCPATPAGTIMTNDLVDGYMPTSVTINAGQVVKFMTSASHDVSPDASSPAVLHIPFNTTACLMFTQSGMFGFHCSIHGFSGSVVVQ